MTLIPESPTSAPVVGFCTQCGQPALAGDRFCRNCGEPIRPPLTE